MLIHWSHLSIESSCKMFARTGGGIFDGFVDEQLEDVEWRVFTTFGFTSIRRRRRIV